MPPTMLLKAFSLSAALAGVPSSRPRKPRSIASTQRLDDLFGHLLGVAEQHHRVVAEEQLVLDAGIARAHAALDEEHGLRLLDVEDRHAEDRRLWVGLGGGIGDVV